MGTTVRSSGGGRKPNLAKTESSLKRLLPPGELMGPAAISIWKTQSKILIERGNFELEDAPLLMAYCNSFHLMLEAEKTILAEGFTDIGGTGGLKKHPAVAVRNDCVAQLARIGSLLGLDPLSRNRAGKVGGENSNVGEFDEF